VKVFNGSFEEYKAKLRTEFDGGSILTAKRKAEAKEKKNKGEQIKEEKKEEVKKPVGTLVKDTTFLRDSTTNNASNPATSSGEARKPVASSTGGYVPPHLRNKEDQEKIDSAFDD
jgi:ATP-binding cassette subfamily F protein 2